MGVGEMGIAEESDGFLGGKRPNSRPAGCCRSKHTKNCCIAAGVFGALFILFGIVLLAAGKGILEKKILESMAITPGSSILGSWLDPPVQAYMEAYAFHLTNPEEVLKGGKPHVEEKGPYVFRSDTIKDSDGAMRFEDGDEAITFRQRKIYTYVPHLSVTENPDQDFLTVPNIPFWTGLNKVRRSTSSMAKTVTASIIKDNGRGQPFINVSFSGLLWGYDDELPCLRLDLPAECSGAAGGGGGESKFSFGGFDDDDDDDFGFGDDDFEEDYDNAEEETSGTLRHEKGGVDDAVEEDEFQPPPDSTWERLVKPKAEFIDCKCEWGLFRDRNVTLRKSIKFLTGLGDLGRKGKVTKYNGKSSLGWWKKESECDQVKGQDVATFPPGMDEDSQVEIFIDLMCRTIKLSYEKEVTHGGIRSLRFIAPKNALGTHDDSDPSMVNPDNECYCLQNEGFTCFKSGVMNMEPCKRKDQAPIVLSMPHFYNADQHYTDAVKGLEPSKEKHEFYLDVVPELGLPLAVQPMFQLNVVLFREPAMSELSRMEKEIILPFLWAKVGFNKPSDVLVEKVKFGLAAPDRLPLLGSVIFLVLGGSLLLAAFGYFLWSKSSDRQLTTAGKSAIVI